MYKPIKLTYPLLELKGSHDHDHKSLALASDFTYLRSPVFSTANIDEELHNRLGKAWEAVVLLSHFYGAEAWTIYTGHK